VGGKAPFHKRAKNPEMIQQNKTFIPFILPVQTGTVVEFPNLDPLYHNVFSYSRAKRFDLGRYDEGKSKTVKFDQPGVVDVFCEIHDNMHAYVLVLDSPWFTQVSANGNYSLDVPAGDYKVYAWIPSRQSEPVEIKLDGNSSSGQADFSF
jgi:plastocyanin